MADETCTDCGDDATLPTAGADPRGTKVLKWGPTLLAPIGKPTGDKRRFAAGALTNRDLPLPLKWQRADSQGHGGASVVGTLDGIVYDEDGAPHGFGLLFRPDAEQLPRLAEDAAEARMLWESGAIGPSVDLDDMEFRQLDSPDGEYAAEGTRPEIEVTRGRISAVTLVPIPAFAEAGGRAILTEVDPDEYAAELAEHNAGLTASVRIDGWDDLPVADQGMPFDAAGARARLLDWAGGDVGRYASAFLWSGDGHKFPLADVVDGELALVPAAVYAAEAVLAGERGETVVPGPDRAAMRGVLADLRERFTPETVELTGMLSQLDEEEFATFADLAEELALDEEGSATFGARFDKLKAKLAAKGISNPAALAGKIGFMKYGKKGMARLRAGVAASKVKPLHGARTAAGVMEAMVAAATLNDATPVVPPAEWFADPKLTGPTPITVTPDGRVFGHLAAWKTCHTGFPGACVTPPKSRSGYAYFHTGAIDTTEGELAVGRVSLGGGHADTRVGFQAAAEHYDNTSTQAATVRAGEDKFGIWVAGTVVPGADVDTLRRSPLSGDWRRIGGQLELVHALAVNSPGFPVPRGNMVAGAQSALVAAGVLDPAGTGERPEPVDVRSIVMEAVTTYREVEQAFARRTQAVGVLAKMDDDADDSEATARKLRARKAAKTIAMAAPTGGGGY